MYEKISRSYEKYSRSYEKNNFFLLLFLILVGFRNLVPIKEKQLRESFRMIGLL